MSYKVRIRNNETGEIRTHTLDLNWLEHSDWWWTEGNFGCDCNRDNEFKRAGNEPLSEEKNSRCGNTKYSVDAAYFEDGSTITIDGDFEGNGN